MNLKDVIIVTIAVVLTFLMIRFTLGDNQAETNISAPNKVSGEISQGELSENVKKHNEQFTKYEGKQSGTNVKALLDNCIENKKVNKMSQQKVPNIYFDKIGDQEKVFIRHGFGDDSKLQEFKRRRQGNFLDVENENVVNSSEVYATYIGALEAIKNTIEDEHYYLVRVSYVESHHYVNTVAILYDENSEVEDHYLSYQSKIMKSMEKSKETLKKYTEEKE